MPTFQEISGISAERAAEIIATAPRGKYLGELLIVKNMTIDEQVGAKNYFECYANGNMTFNSMIYAAASGY